MVGGIVVGFRSKGSRNTVEVFRVKVASVNGIGDGSLGQRLTAVRGEGARYWELGLTDFWRSQLRRLI